MLLSAPRFALPETVAEAVAALAERPGAAVVAGGTELLPDLLWRRKDATGFVSLRRVAALRELAGPAAAPAATGPAAAAGVPGAGLPGAGVSGAGVPGAGGPGAGVPGAGVGGRVLTLGAGVPVARLTGADVVAAAPGLARAAASLGTPQVRAEATVGGNVVSALPYRNLLPVLLALGARLRLDGPAGPREVPFDGFVTAPGRTRLGPGELLTAVTVPVLDGYQDYVKIGRRNAQFVATVSAAVVVDAGARRVQLAFGNAAPVPFRSDAVDRAATAAVDWATGAVSAAGAAEAAAVVRREADPPDDDAAPAAYRRHALGVLTERLLGRCADG